VNGTRVGYARCSIDEQDVTVQTDQLAVLGVTPDRISIDRGFSGTSRRNRAGRGNARHGTPMRRRRVGTARAVVTMTGPVAGPGVEPGGPPS
jgi:ribosomal protein L3